MTKKEMEQYQNLLSEHENALNEISKLILKIETLTDITRNMRREISQSLSRISDMMWCLKEVTESYSEVIKMVEEIEGGWK